ncbi:right-handed parallel beta-helix repeat-containing protein [Coleofasciculus sp. FACHB-64]|uniref:right-handed parallel beta-helix repeat-containing protein n=1 Tax=Cyanophyceae TaxID=3028117 RepID=UPI0016893CD0|nr:MULTISPECIES: right-handed parallel beta-helix repeat-containing protein [unclassified Coleofasciculus]MBD1840099.1 right-handed parallel beta-helix repeat-containing protein [Coleofasciculus sp. FACHB-501]MBD2044898.1 right-handed parallel beta-helix repeat-containing protein [Coleofasciculus sp. FACHB-64]
MKFFQKLALTAALTTISINPSYAATFTVNNTADSGAGSLRQAIIDANTASGDDIIDFLLGAGPQTINVSSELDITDNLLINGLGADLLTLSGSGGFSSDYVLNIGGGVVANLGVTVGISGLTVTNGSNGIRNNGTATLTNVSVSGNVLDGIVNAGKITLNNSTVSGNGQNGFVTVGTAIVTNSTISGSGANGINSAGNRINPGSLTVTNSTVSGNGFSGINNAFAQVTVTNSTITGNSGSGFFSSFSSTSNIGNTIIAQNSTDIRRLRDVAINDLGYNLIGNGDGTPFVNGVNGNIVGTTAAPVDPLLGPLANNGGSTQTQALLPGSPAIDAANPNSFPATDQRGVTRPQGARADIGAFELAQTPSQPVPEPGTVLGLAGLSLFGLLRKKARFNHQ